MGTNAALERQQEGKEAGSAMFLLGGVWIQQSGNSFSLSKEYCTNPVFPISVFQVWQED